MNTEAITCKKKYICILYISTFQNNTSIFHKIQFNRIKILEFLVLPVMKNTENKKKMQDLEK